MLNTVGVSVILQGGGRIGVGWAELYQSGHLVRRQEKKEYSLIKRAAAKSAEVYEAAISPRLRETKKILFLTDIELFKTSINLNLRRRLIPHLA